MGVGMTMDYEALGLPEPVTVRRGQSVFEITYLVQNPARYTFEAPQVKRWVEAHSYGAVLNLFAGRTQLKLDEYRVDLDPTVHPDFCGDAFEFVQTTEMRFDTIILDPPWSERKAREKYGGRMIGRFTKLKDHVQRILKPGGRIITVGYSSTGMSASRGFKKVALCVINHGGDHDDAFAVAEDAGKDAIITVEQERVFHGLRHTQCQLELVE